MPMSDLAPDSPSGDGAVLSKRLQFVRVGADGNAAFAGWAPHLDLEPLPSATMAELVSNTVTKIPVTQTRKT